MIHKVIVADRDLTVLEELTNEISNLRWEYNRIGGCGAFSFDIPRRLYEDLTLGGNFNIKISRRNPSTGDFDLWYQGRIEDKDYNVSGNEEKISVRGMGYQSELSDIYIDADFSSQEISVVVKNLLDNYIVPNTNITYDSGDITATTFTADTLEFNTDALSAMQTLADITGTREWGVDKNRKFFFKVRSSTVGFRYNLPSKVLKIDISMSSKEIVNRVIVTGGDVAGSPFGATYNDTASQLKWKRRDKSIQNSAIVTSAVASQFADAIFAEFNDIVKRARINLLDERQIESTIPIPLFQVLVSQIKYGEKKYGTFLYSGLVSYQVNRIQYDLDDDGNLTISMQVGQLRPSISENISQLSHQIEQLRQQGV